MRALMTVNLPEKFAPNGHQGFISDTDLREMLRKLRLLPADLPTAEAGEAFRIYEEKLHHFFLDLAAPIIKDMPGDPARPEEPVEQRRLRAMANTVFACYMPGTGTHFMVEKQNDGQVLFRLRNDKIEKLKEGCTYLIDRIQKLSVTDPDAVLVIEGDISVFERGLEDSTITGKIVKSRIASGMRTASRDLVLVGVAAILLTGTWAAKHLGGIDYHSHPIWNGHFDRLQTAMETLLIVSGASFSHAVLQASSPVEWS